MWITTVITESNPVSRRIFDRRCSKLGGVYVIPFHASGSQFLRPGRKVGAFFRRNPIVKCKIFSDSEKKSKSFFFEIITFHFSLHFLNIEIRIWLPKRKRSLGLYDAGFLYRLIYLFFANRLLNECVAIFKYF